MSNLPSSIAAALMLCASGISYSDAASTLTAGATAACAVAVDGTVKCWGSNAYGQLGSPALGDAPESRVPVDVALPQGTRATKVVAGLGHACALLADEVWCWGDDSKGQLGDDDSDSNGDPFDDGGAVPRPVVGLPAVVDLATEEGSSHTCARTADGQAWCWGQGSSGQLGNGQVTNQAKPVQVFGLNGTWDAIAVGTAFTCGINVGTIYCWGANGKGQVSGNGQNPGPATDPHPNALPLIAGGETAAPASISAGGEFVCAVDANGSIWCWGDNSRGQLGLGGTSAQTAPARIAGLSALSVSTGEFHACAREATRTSCWGFNAVGQLGDGTTVSRSIPTPMLLEGSAAVVAPGGFYTCARRYAVGDDIRCWGSNAFAAVGNGVPIMRAEPQLVLGLPDSAGVSIDVLAGGDAHTCSAVHLQLSSHYVYCWGANPVGQLGDGTDIPHPLPVAAVDGDGALFAAGSVQGLAAGGNHSCAAVTSAEGVDTPSLWCWGNNDDRELGVDGADRYSASLVDDAALRTQPALSLSSGNRHSCAVFDAGDHTSTRCWGSDEDGQLGDGPMQHDGGTSMSVEATAAATDFDVVSAGYAHTCAVSRPNGLIQSSVWCWGQQQYGRLGNGSGAAGTVDAPAPVFTASAARLNNAIAVSAGLEHTCALMTPDDGRVFCWGHNANGQLGNGTNVDSPYAVVVDGWAAAGDHATKVAVGSHHSCAVVESASGAQSVYCWGSNASGQLGNADAHDALSARLVDGLPVANASRPITHLMVSNDHSCVAIATDGVYCWGSNDHGQLGNGETGLYVEPQPVTDLGNPDNIFGDGVDVEY